MSMTDTEIHVGNPAAMNKHETILYCRVQTDSFLVANVAKGSKVVSLFTELCS